jgi:CO/xanthine dehydrogenase Mo-binding subunit
MNAVGSDVVRRDARVRATGAVRYVEDIVVDGMLRCVIVRSTVAAGRVVAIETAAAARAPGVVRILTAADVTRRRYGNYVQDQPILATDRVRFVGEPVALVAATSRAAARRAAALVDVVVETEPHVIDLEEAAADRPGVTVHDRPDNELERVMIRRGDVESVFAAPHKIVTTRVTTHRVHQAYLEPRAVLATPTEHGLSIVMSTQQPFGVRAAIADLFELPEAAVDVEVPAIGGGFGGKLHLGLAPQAAAMAIATGRPVQIVCARDEDMATGNPRENSIVELTSAVDAEGIIRARRCDVILDAGAYAMDTPVLASIAAFYAGGPYRIDDLDVTARAIYTNTCPTGSFRGPGGTQMVFAVETHMDELADAVGLDRAEIRRRNFIRTGDRGPTGELMRAASTAEACMEVVLQRLDEFRMSADTSDTRARGYGFACAWWSTLGTPSGATVQLHDDASATITTGATEIGSGSVSMGLPAIVAQVLGLEPGRITLHSGSTRDAPHDPGTRGSRTMFAAGSACLLAAQEVARLVKEEASILLEVDAADLVLAEGRVEVTGSPASGMPLRDVAASARARSGPLVASARYRAEPVSLEGSQLHNTRFSALGEPTFHCHGAEIAVDTDTGRVEVIRYIAVHDAGRIINPVGARGQVEGGVVQGIGYALTEHLMTDVRGAIRNPNFVDYRIPTTLDVPTLIDTVFVESNPSAAGPFGAKGLGEPPVILPAPVIGSALRDALGCRLTRLPFDAPTVADTLAGSIESAGGNTLGGIVG